MAILRSPDGAAAVEVAGPVAIDHVVVPAGSCGYGRVGALKLREFLGERAPTPHTECVNPYQPAARSIVLHVARLAGAAVALGLFAAAMWFAWLGWDNEYYQVDGVAQGPYRAWQVIGCGLSIAAAAVLAYLWVRGVWAIFVLAAAADIGFAVPWTRDAASTDDSGLFVVGLLFLLVGAGVGLVVLLAATAAVATRHRPRLRGDD